MSETCSTTKSHNLSYFVFIKVHIKAAGESIHISFPCNMVSQQGHPRITWGKHHDT